MQNQRKNANVRHLSAQHLLGKVSTTLVGHRGPCHPGHHDNYSRRRPEREQGPGRRHAAEPERPGARSQIWTLTGSCTGPCRPGAVAGTAAGSAVSILRWPSGSSVSSKSAGQQVLTFGPNGAVCRSRKPPRSTAFEHLSGRSELGRVRRAALCLIATLRSPNPSRRGGRCGHDAPLHAHYRYSWCRFDGGR